MLKPADFAHRVLVFCCLHQDKEILLLLCQCSCFFYGNTPKETRLCQLLLTSCVKVFIFRHSHNYFTQYSAFKLNKYIIFFFNV